MRELFFEVTQEPDGGYRAEALRENLFTQGDTWEELREMVPDGTRAHICDAEPPATIRLHLRRAQVLAVARNSRAKSTVRNCAGSEKRWEYTRVQQTGSHIVLRTGEPFPQTVSVPAHKPLKAGNLAGIVRTVAEHKQVDRNAVLHALKAEGLGVS